jgi:ATP-dependent metalloprotease
MSLGMTVQLPELDKDSFTRKEYLAQIDVCMGGRAAEELIFGKDEVTSGSHNDLMKATDVAKKMVMYFGMGEHVGKMYHSDHELEKVSPQTRQQIERDVKELLDSSYERAYNILKENKIELERLAVALTEYETLDQREIESVIKGETIQKDGHRFRKSATSSESGPNKE